MQGRQEDEGTQPESGLHFVLYNEQMDVVEANTGILPVDDRINRIQDLSSDKIVIQESGYLEVFVNNEAQTPVYYDNLVVMQSTGNVIEVNAYYPYGKIIQGLSTSSTYGKNNYKYNGKELQTELELGWLDYGARMLDGPRWFVPDPLAETFYYESPYIYAGNNPIKMIDVGGKYKMNSVDIKRYSVLAAYLKTGIQEILNSPNIMNGLNKYGSFTEQDVKELITSFGKGIEIELTDYFPDGGNGEYSSKRIRIHKELAQQLQNANSEDFQAALLAIISTILHESVHYGHDNLGQPTDPTHDGIRYFRDLGQMFELDVYFNQDIDKYANGDGLKRGKKGLKNMKELIEMNSHNEVDKKDMPGYSWEEIEEWMNRVLNSNPNTNIIVQ